MKRVFFTLFIGVGLTTLAMESAADRIYKSVDAAGNVTYSSEPPAGTVSSKTVDLPPAPTRAEIEEAQRIAEQTRLKAEEMARDREARAAGKQQGRPVQPDVTEEGTETASSEADVVPGPVSPEAERPETGDRNPPRRPLPPGGNLPQPPISRPVPPISRPSPPISRPSPPVATPLPGGRVER
jgi:hypothetical protein